jgi:hypothetical protein
VEELSAKRGHRLGKRRVQEPRIPDAIETAELIELFSMDFENIFNIEKLRVFHSASLLKVSR